MKKTYCIGISAKSGASSLHDLKILDKQYATEAEAEKEIQKTMANKAFEGNIFYVLPCFDTNTNRIIKVN